MTPGAISPVGGASFVQVFGVHGEFRVRLINKNERQVRCDVRCAAKAPGPGNTWDKGIGESNAVAPKSRHIVSKRRGGVEDGALRKTNNRHNKSKNNKVPCQPNATTSTSSGGRNHDPQPTVNTRANFLTFRINVAAALMAAQWTRTSSCTPAAPSK